MINVALVQSSASPGDKEKNFDKVNNLLDTNPPKDCDILVLPELFATGWVCDIFPKVAEHFEESSILDFVKNIAVKYNTNVIGGSFARLDKDETIKNSCPFVDRKGNLVGMYDKMHLYSYLGDTEGTYAKPGKNPVIISSDVGKIGLSICYDIRFPEIYRSYAFNGADLLVNVAAWPLSRKLQYKTLCAARAIENQSFFVSLSQTGDIGNGVFNLGYSAVYDPWGNTVASLKHEETVLFAKIDLQIQKDLRKEVKTLSDKHENYNPEVI